MNYYEHHLGDYIRDAGHLSMLEDGAYRRLMDAYYIREEALPVDTRETSRLIRAQTRSERQAVMRVLQEFFVLREDGWHHSRCDKEIARYLDKRQKAQASAQARWSPKAMRTHCDGDAHQTPVTNHQTPFLLSEEKREGEGSSQGTRLSEAWQLGEADRAFAMSLGLELHETHFQAAKFKDFWAGKPGRDGIKTDWHATWRNWARNAFERKAQAKGARVALPDAGAAPTYLYVRGEPEHEAWLAHYVRIGRHRDPNARFLDRLTVPSRFPPDTNESAANESAANESAA